MNSLKYVPSELVRNTSGNLINNIIMFVGEAPGAQEEKYGRPFIGPSGKLLRSAIKDTDIPVYVLTNVVCVRPENNRTPTKEEILSWERHLVHEIDVFKPLRVVAVGKTAHKALEGFKGINVANIHHPSYILRRRSLEAKWREEIKKIIKESVK